MTDAAVASRASDQTEAGGGPLAGVRVIELGMLCREQAGWHRSTSSARGVVIGPMSHVGATTAYERAEMVGGRVQFEGIAGRGTIVSVRVPTKR